MRTTIGKLTTVACVAVAALTSTTVNAWKYQGHLLVARMAHDLLQEQNPQALAKAETLLHVMTGDNLTESERDHIFVEAAPFADVIKYKGGGWQSNWHFVDIPFLDQGGDVNEYPNFVEDPKNISVAIPGIVDWLRNTPGHQDNFAYITIMNAVKQNEERGRSYALRLLIHYLGDVHQPLHAMSRVDSDYPAGDRGGNSFPLPGHYSAKELHAVWDSVVYEFHVNDKLPYDEASWNTLSASVSKLRSRFTIQPNEYSVYNVQAWAEETFETGAANVYKGAAENVALPQDYVTKNNNVAARQLVLASHRLAKVITLIFGTSSSSVETVVDIPEVVVDSEQTTFLQ